MNKIAIGLIMLIIIVPIALASPFNADGFEDGNYNANPTWSFDFADGYSVSSTTAAEGTYSLKFQNNGNNRFEIASYDPGTTETIGVGDYVEVWMQKASGLSDYAANFYGSGGNYIKILYYSTTKLQVACSAGAGTDLYTSVSNGVWYRVRATYAGSNNWNVVAYNAAGSTLGSHTQACTLGTSWDYTQLKSYDHTDSGIFYYDNVTYFTNATAPPPVGTNTTFTVNVNDLFNDTDVAGANVTLYNGSAAVYSALSNSTGDVQYSVNSTGAPATLNFNVTKAGYFGLTGQTVAANTTATANLSQGSVNVTSITSLISGTVLGAALGTWTVNTTGGKTYAECAATYPCLIYLQNGTNNLTLQYSGAGGYYAKNFQVNITAPEAKSGVVAGVYDEVLTVTSNYLGAPITNTTAMNVSNATHSFLSSCSTTTGSCTFNIEQGLLYFIISNPAGFQAQNTTVIGNASTQTVTFSHLIERTFNFTIRDEITRALINETMTIELISDDDASTYTTATGNLTLSLLTPNEYTVRYASVSYPERDYYETILDESYFDIDLYAISFNDSVDTLITVVDTSNAPVEGATVKLLRYYVYCNCYEVVEMAKTSSSGQAFFNAQSIEGHYKWVVQLGGNTYFTSTTPETLLPDPATGIITRTFTVNLGQAFYESYQGFRNLSQTFTKTFAPLTNQTTLVYTWNDANNIVAEVCLKAEYLDGVDFETYDVTCSSDSAGSLVMVLNNSQDRKYKYRVSLDSGSTYSVENVFTGWTEDVADYNFGNTGYFIGAILLIVLAGAMSFSVVAVTVVVVIGVAALSLLGIAPFAADFIAGLIAMMVGTVAYLYRQG